jgi:hypothetical protein
LEAQANGEPLLYLGFPGGGYGPLSGLGDGPFGKPKP